MVIILIFIVIIVVLVLLAVNYSDNQVVGQAFGKPIKYKDVKNIDVKKLEKETEQLRKNTKYISERQDYYFEIVRNAKKFEGNKEIEKAINNYESALNYAYNEPVLKIHNYAFSIHRLIVLYGKTKQKDKLKTHLEESINKHPNWKDVEDWRKRINKLLN